METIIPITRSNALKAIKNAKSEETKQAIADLCGEELKLIKSWQDIKTWEDVCEVNGEDPSADYFLQGEKDDIGYKMAKRIVKAINMEWVPDWSNINQLKYYIWWEYSASGSAFRFYVCTYYYGVSTVGSRLVFESTEKAKHAAAHFTPLFNQFLN